MKLSVLFTCLLLSIAFCQGAKKKPEEHQEHVEREKEESRSSEEERRGEEELPFKLSERTKQVLIHEKSRTNVLLEKALEYFMANPNRQFERQCFEQNFNPGESVDFVIDVASSPSEDSVDKSIAESPMALYFDIFGVHSGKRTPSRSYFNSIRTFIDAVTLDMKPESTQSCIYEKGNKYYICGKKIESHTKEALKSQGGQFSDSNRNLETMWPNPTKEIPEGMFHPYLKNSLGRMTKSALWNRNNGLPTVMARSRCSNKSVYTIVISDGSSGAKIRDLVGDDLSRTTVIDIGNRRFVKSLDWNDLRSLVSVVTLSAPQQLGTMVDTCRNLACRFCGCKQE